MYPHSVFPISARPQKRPPKSTPPAKFGARQARALHLERPRGSLTAGNVGGQAEDWKAFRQVAHEAAQ